MTKDARKKKEIRARMALTGESYMQARRAIEEERAEERCRHGEADGSCPSCAACAACSGTCDVCPYVAPPTTDAEEAQS